jgi:Uma2 family endonuclease
MTETTSKIQLPPAFPDHTQLPESDGTFVQNFQEHPQSIILTDSLTLKLQELHPDGNYAIGQDCGIYWRETEPPEQGAEAPDWFYVPNVPPLLDGQIRRSYVIWREFIAPTIALEFASGNGEERDRTPRSLDPNDKTRPGKFWVYEQIVHIPYYGIYEIRTGNLEVYTLVGGIYQRLEPNDRGHYPIPPLGVELGLWQGNYQNQNQLWLRWWDENGNLLLTGWEQTELERLRVEQERQRADAERERNQQMEILLEEERKKMREAIAKAERLAQQLRSQGLDPEV